MNDDEDPKGALRSMAKNSMEQRDALIDVCKHCRTALGTHTAFKDWPMALPPVPSPAEMPREERWNKAWEWHERGKGRFDSSV